MKMKINRRFAKPHWKVKCVTCHVLTFHNHMFYFVETILDISSVKSGATCSTCLHHKFCFMRTIR